MDVIELKKIANEVRKGIVTSVHSAKAGHPGGSLSAADVFTYLYFEEMNIDPADPKKADRDRFVLSKGHTAPGLYSVLAQRGYFPVEDLKTLRHIGSYLQGHPDMKHIQMCIRDRECTVTLSGARSTIASMVRCICSLVSPGSPAIRSILMFINPASLAI